jgi:hypothetical protein
MVVVKCLAESHGMGFQEGQALTAACLGWLLFGESLAPPQYIGAALVRFGTWRDSKPIRAELNKAPSVG